MNHAEIAAAQRDRSLSLPGIGAVEAELLAMLAQQIERFVTREIDSDAMERAGEIPASVREAAASRGLFGFSIPEAYGGLGLSLKASSHVVQRLARADASVAIMIGLHAGLGTRPIVAFGSPALRERWLPELASGACIASFAATEANAGSDLGAIRTAARAEGVGLSLSGEKSYVTNGGFAGLFTVLAATPSFGGARGQSLMCVPRGAPGVEVGAEEQKLGIRASSTVTVRFDGVRVEPGELLGEPGRGVTQAHEALAWGRTLMAGGCVGIAESALARAIEHVGIRRQFGRSLSAFSAVRAQVASMAARIYAMETLARDAATAEGRGSLEALSSMAKVFCSEGTFEVCDRAVQLHGALGFIEGVGVARLLRDCRITRIFEGANDVLLLRLGAAALSGGLNASARPASSDCDELRARWSASLTTLRSAYGIGAVARQDALQQLARASIALHAAGASLRRAEEDPGDHVMAQLAASELIEEGHRLLDGLAKEGPRARRAEAVASTLLGPVRGTRRGGLS